MRIKTDERIKVVNGYAKDSYKYIPVVIIGAGESGIAAACQPKSQLGFDQFRVYDRQSGFGGTWWINRYPGIACDVPTPYYSFSWRPNREATELYPSGAELIRYFQQVASEYGVVDKFNLNTEVSELRWLEDEKQWETTVRYMAHGTGDLSKYDREKLIREQGEEAVYIGKETIRAKAVISCVGGLVEPRDWPEDVTGWDKFQGDLMHTARWKQDVDLTGKDVILVGTGCSAAQATPRLVHHPYNAKSVTQIMRTPPWVLPKTQEPGGKEWYKENAPWLAQNIPGLHTLLRWYIAVHMELLWFTAYGDSDTHRERRKKQEKKWLARMKHIVPERYHEMLTPDFEVLCKRRIFDREWYEGFNDDRIRLTTQKLVSVDEHSVTLQGGGKFPDREDDPTGQTDVTLHADAIILANGFDTLKWLHPIKVLGRGGKSLHDVWDERGGAQAYNGAAMDGFPNFFIVFGPNCATGHNSVILATENMVNYSIKFVKQILEGDVETFEVKKEAEMAYSERTQRELKTKVFHVGGCLSWYFNQETGWNSTMHPRSQWDHTLRCMFPKWSDWNIELTRKGLWKRRVGQAVRTLLAVAAVVGAYRMRQSGVKLKHVPTIAKMTVKMGLMSLLGTVAATAERWQEALF